tara:strand:- start:287 stop:424 length:138 start_codon:yes stop_codon:yes gene_type:complete
VEQALTVKVMLVVAHFMEIRAIHRAEVEAHLLLVVLAHLLHLMVA